jgi:hypothetical protein
VSRKECEAESANE